VRLVPESMKEQHWSIRHVCVMICLASAGLIVLAVLGLVVALT
jgi:hypothetical protein